MAARVDVVAPEATASIASRSVRRYDTTGVTLQPHAVQPVAEGNEDRQTPGARTRCTPYCYSAQGAG
jgi:hypothetical protein